MEKLNNLLCFSDFEKNWNPKEQKQTKHTDVGLDVLNEGLFDGFFLKSALKKALSKCDSTDNYIKIMADDFVRKYKNEPDSVLTKSYRKDINNYLKSHIKNSGDYIMAINKLKSYGFVNDPDYKPSVPSYSSDNYSPKRGSSYDNSYTSSTRIGRNVK